MNNSEDVPRRLRIVLSEYGSSVTTESLKSDEVTSENGVVSWEKLAGFDGLTEEDHQLVKTLREAGTKIEILELKKGGLRIKADTFVGHVAFGTFDLIIRPKFDHLATCRGKESLLATLLRYAFNLGDVKIIGKQISPETSFADILIHWLLGEVRNIQRRGLFQQYRKERRDLSVIRGKIDLKTWLRRGGIPSERMPCVFHRRSLDNILNQTLCAGLRRSVAIANSDTLKSECRYLADDFALSISDRTLDYRMLAEARRGLNRLNAHYENAIHIVEMLYAGSGGFVLGATHQKQIRISGFFFDMNVLFERIIGKFLEKNLPKRYKVKTQSRFRIFFDKSMHENNLPSIRPDIIISKKGKDGNIERLALDTKYKDIEEKRVKSADLYQLTVYALTCSHHGKQAERRARIIYPTDRDTQERCIVLRRSQHIGGGNLCEITLCPIDLRHLAEVIGKGEEERKRFALKIIGEQTGNSGGATPESQEKLIT